MKQPYADEPLPYPTELPRQVSGEVGAAVGPMGTTSVDGADPFPDRGQRLPPPPGGARPVRSGTAILGRYNDHLQQMDMHHQDRLDPHGAGHHIGAQFNHAAEAMHLDSVHVAERQANALQAAKDRGLATPQMIEHITAHPGVNPYAVSELPLDIQAGFRRKMLMLLFLQLAFSVGLALMLRLIEPISDKIEEIFKPQGAGALGLMCAVLLGLPLMSCIKDKHPLNLIFTLVWSCILGVFLAASDLPGAYSRAHAFMIIMLMLTAGVFFLMFFSNLRTRDIEGNPAMWKFSTAGLVSWVCWLTCGIVAFTQLRDKVEWGEPDDEEGKPFDPTPIMVTASIVATIVYAWFCYEAYKLCCKMQPDEYMKGVIYFYTDMFYVCACCALLACLGGGGGGGNAGAPPRDEEER